LAPDVGARGVRCRIRDAGRLLLAGAVVAELLVELRVLHARTRVLLLAHCSALPFVVDLARGLRAGVAGAAHSSALACRAACSSALLRSPAGMPTFSACCFNSSLVMSSAWSPRCSA